MLVEAKNKENVDITYMELDVEPRYWEDMQYNDKTCEENDMSIWGRHLNLWKMIFNLETGKVENWIPGNVAKVHFKVCDAGLYYLLDKDKKRLFFKDGYVPEGVCHGDRGYGDYIIMNINEDGYIEKYNFSIDMEYWKEYNNIHEHYKDGMGEYKRQ